MTIRQRIEALDRRIADLEFLYWNSSWAMGPDYRRRIADAKSERQKLINVLEDDAA